MEHLNTSVNKKLDGIQCLRAFAILLVILSHYSIIINDLVGPSGFLNILTQNSPFAVDLFFFISGFIMVYTTKGNIKSRFVRFSDFLIKRLLRIFPVYYFCLIIFVIFVVMYDKSYQYNSMPWDNILKSFLLIPNNYHDKPPFYGYSLIIPAWTITYEVYFYIIFSLTLIITSRYRTAVCSIVLLIISFSMQLYSNGKITIDAQGVDYIQNGILGNLSFMSNPIIYDFIIGMLIGEFFISDKRKHFSGFINTITPLCLCFGITAFLSMFRYGYGLTHGAIGAFFLLFAVINYDFNKSVTYPKALIFIGNISYSLYISHIVVISIADRYSEALFVYTQSYGWRRYCIILVIAITVATMMHKFIEIPTTRLAKNIINRIKTRSLQS